MQGKTEGSVVLESKEKLKNDVDHRAETKVVLHINYCSIKTFLNDGDILKDIEANWKEHLVVKLKHFYQRN